VPRILKSSQLSFSVGTAVAVSGLLDREERSLSASTPASRSAWHRACAVLAGGVASSFQRGDPWPIAIERGEGAAVWDADGTRRLDFHCGFGAMVQGHAHPAIVRALAERHPRGTHFAAAAQDAVLVGEELARRFRLPRWRFANSGTEATLDAIRIARGFTGREVVVKALGAYHGHHDAVMIGGGALRAVDSAGIPAAVVDLTATVPYNDADALEATIKQLDRAGHRPACVILEPAMMLGMIVPRAGYLAAVRDITRRFEVVLIFDEVKTGLTVASGGAVERFGVVPDLVTLAKALGGGLPCGAIGGSETVMSVLESGAVLQAGTFNANPLSMAAARASLYEVLTPAAYERLERLGARMVSGCAEVLSRHGLPGHALSLGARGCVSFASERLVDYETYAAQHNPRLSRLLWLYAINRGLLLAPGRPQQWTISVAHADGDVDAFLTTFARLLGELLCGSGRRRDDRAADDFPTA
jgi:glutamate-1-semialdehyde 2,1-aminomutase